LNRCTNPEEQMSKKTKKPEAEKTEAVTPAPPVPPDVEPVEEEVDADDPWEGERPPKHYVLHHGRFITLHGKDVQLRPLTHEQNVTHGIKNVTGAQGMPCEQQDVVLTFKSPAAAFKFFKLCLHAEDETDEYIKSGNKTEWHSARMIDVFAGNEE
jgi:hypothetical protein